MTRAHIDAYVCASQYKDNNLKNKKTITIIIIIIIMIIIIIIIIIISA